MKCRLCGYEFFDRVVFEIDQAPQGAQYYPLRTDFTADTGIRLKLCSCPVCNLHQLDSFPVAYYRDVIRSGGYTETMVSLRRKQYAKMLHDFRLIDRSVFECGCGRGEFLSVWDEYPVRAVGIENSQALVDEALSAGLNVEQGFIGDASDELSFGECDAFTSFNFLEHQPNPNGMLQGIFSNLAKDGCGLITVPAWEYIEEKGAYYELIVDHLTYFSRDTFIMILNRNGFYVEDFDDSLEDTHAAFVRKASFPLESKIGKTEDKISLALVDFALTVQEENGSLVVWGASHQAFTILACAGISRYVDYIVDSAEFKQGKYSPGSHLPIRSPEVLAGDKVSGVVVIAPNYTAEIVSIIRSGLRLVCPIISIRDGRTERF